MSFYDVQMGNKRCNENDETASLGLYVNDDDNENYAAELLMRWVNRNCVAG